jgi:hypothetical protein
LANEITASASLSYLNSTVNVSVAKALAISGSNFSVTGSRYVEGLFSVPTSAGGTAIPIPAGTLGWCIIKNNDSTNYVELLTAVSGSVFAKIAPGEVAMFRFPSAITAPAALANTAAVKIEFLILEA